MYHQNSGDDHARRTTRRTAWWTLDSIGSVVGFVFAILSVIAGFTLLSSPLWGAMFLWWFLAIALIVLGGLNVIRAIAGKKA